MDMPERAALPNATMKLFTSLGAAAVAVTGFAAPAQALPIWSRVIARSTCEYLVMGVPTDTANVQALLDNKHYAKEVQTASRLGTFGVTWVNAIKQTCPSQFHKIEAAMAAGFGNNQ